MAQSAHACTPASAIVAAAAAVFQPFVVVFNLTNTCCVSAASAAMNFSISLDFSAVSMLSGLVPSNYLLTCCFARIVISPLAAQMSFVFGVVLASWLGCSASSPCSILLGVLNGLFHIALHVVVRSLGCAFIESIMCFFLKGSSSDIAKCIQPVCRMHSQASSAHDVHLSRCQQ